MTIKDRLAKEHLVASFQSPKYKRDDDVHKAFLAGWDACVDYLLNEQFSMNTESGDSINVVEVEDIQGSKTAEV